ncbi:MAG TPA: glucose-6-phosphate dehydrogenase assembly protein OpcA [Candidatus Sulfotelmatobacter sp.]|nr:glucose-6-phosphate dehydrogenase assembly protein OpcA [Candidatus Sulfotelmatobacter sp.]
MTEQLAPPALQLVDPPRSWSARADSVPGIERELSRMWAAAAQETLRSADPTTREAARGDPRLGGRLDTTREVRVRMRTRVLTLIVVAAHPETQDRAMDAINLLAARHPSRAVILAPGDPDGPSWLDARIYAQCQVQARGNAEVCTEQILARCGGELAYHLSELVTPLLIHDLPVVLWWPDDPPLGRGQFADLADEVDRVLVDSGSFRDDGAARLVALGRIVAEGRLRVLDVGWLRLSLWRELLAGAFDHPLLAPELPSVHQVRIDVARPGNVLRVAKAALFCGWLATRLGWRLEAPLAAARGVEGLAARYRGPQGPVHVEVRPTDPGTDRALRTPGSLARVELALGRRGSAEVRARVTRHADHLLATADWSGAQVARRAGRLEPFGDAPYLAEALDRGGADRVFEDALAAAALLVGA